MAQPIRDRGIRWKEAYGDKSAYLKREFDKQVGPGSYFRWEGHDHTTGNDYYVVVSPGFSERRGYHFFAGLRKMPANDGASGKYFSTQREALSYAMDMWRVSRPETMPGTWSGLTVNDIRGKPIVLEGLHKRTSSAAKTRVERTAMSMLASGFTGDVQRQQTMEGMKVALCFAHRASPVMGFLAGMQAQPRFNVMDFENRPAGRKGGKAEMRPLLSYPQQPTKERFDEVMKQGAFIENRLANLVSHGGASDVAYLHGVSSEGMGEDDLRNETWGNSMVSPNLRVEVNRIGGLAKSDFYEKMQSMGIVGLPEYLKTGEMPRGARRGRTIIVKPKIPLMNYERFFNSLDSYPGASVGSASGRGSPSPLNGLSNAADKRVFKMMKMREEEGQEFDRDKAYRQYVRARGSQMLIYDDEWNPVGLMAQTDPVARRGYEAFTKGEAAVGGIGKKEYFALKRQLVGNAGEDVPGHVALVDKFSSAPMVMLGWLARVRDAASEASRLGALRMERERMAEQSWDKNVEARYQTMASYWGRLEKRAINNVAKAVSARPYSASQMANMGEYYPDVDMSFWEPNDKVDPGALASEAHGRANALLAMIRSGVDNGSLAMGGMYMDIRKMVKDAPNDVVRERMRDQAANVRYGFREMASHGYVTIDASMTVDSSTCALKTRRADKKTFSVNDVGMPIKPGTPAELRNSPDSLMDPMEVRKFGIPTETRPYGPSNVGGMPEGNYDVRFKVPGKKEYSHGKVDADIPPVSGMPVVFKPRYAIATTPSSAPVMLNPSLSSNRPLVDTESIGERVLSVNAYQSVDMTIKRNDPTMMVRTENNYALVPTVDEEDEVDARVKMTAPQGMFPPTMANLKDVENPDGFQTTYEANDYAHRDQGTLVFSDSWVALQAIKRRISLPTEAIDKFTPLDSSDLMVINQMAKDGQQYYESNKDSDLDFYLDNEAREPDMDSNKLAESRGIDLRRYKYGKTLLECAGGRGIPQGCLDALANALGEHEEAERRRAMAKKQGLPDPGPANAWLPREGTLFSIRYEGEVMYFGTRMAALEEARRLGLNESDIEEQKGPLVPSFIKRMKVAEENGISLSTSDFVRKFETKEEEGEGTEELDEEESDLEPEVEPVEEPEAVEPSIDEPEAVEEPVAEEPAAWSEEVFEHPGEEHPGSMTGQPARPPTSQQEQALGSSPDSFVEYRLRMGDQPDHIRNMTRTLFPGREAEIEELLRRHEARGFALTRLVRMANVMDARGDRRRADAIDEIIRMAASSNVPSRSID